MSIDVKLEGALTGTLARVDSRGSLRVSDTVPDLPFPSELNRYTVFNSMLGPAGATDVVATANMNVDGSSTNVEYCVGSEADVDIHITRLVFIIADTAVVHNNFGNVSALTNGLDVQVTERGITTNLVLGAKTGGQLIAQSGMFSPYGDGTASFELSNWDGTNDAQAVAMDIGAIIPGGIRIIQGSNDKLLAVVKDDLQGLTEFTIRAFGYRHHP